jgi:hypothetical protein
VRTPVRRRSHQTGKNAQLGEAGKALCGFRSMP